ncbi:hypothetical protein [Pseudomonas sp. P9_31]|uniref:hypothetical protein n=1 Tax=Pseudomonas sp. P9_31 TaxID=3043448 RepID=UPI002A36FEA0|nr:hypothetical protein [Pseudomonas sp. P9_31]WPN57929.1 hypothetical protein QMK51_28175 [Pseudomonas sp. P9_31]
MSGLTDFHVFWGAAMEIAEKQSASMEAEGAEDFARGLYDEYVKQGAPKNKKKWLSERLENEFLYLKEKPVWVGEPTWLYHQGRPMVFLHQFLISPSAQHIKEKISLGDTIYVFGSKHILKRSPEDSWTVIYRTAVQALEGETAVEFLE